MEALIVITFMVAYVIFNIWLASIRYKHLQKFKQESSDEDLPEFSPLYQSRRAAATRELDQPTQEKSNEHTSK